MPIDVTEPDTPGWWLQKCAKKLQERGPRLELLGSYLDGDAPLPRDAAPEQREAYRRFRRQSRTNYAELIVETLARRMTLTGILTGADSNRDGDRTAWDMWDNNSMAIELPETLTNMLGKGDGYHMLGLLGEDDAAGPPVERVTITDEDPRQVVTIHDPIRQRIVRTAAKLYHDDDYDIDYAYLHLPGRVHRACRARKARKHTSVRFSPVSWDWDDDFGGERGLETGIPVVPVVRFRNRRGISEFETHLDLLQRLDSNVFRRDVISAVQAWRQKAAIGTPDEDDEGNPIDWDEILTSDPGAFWRLPEGAEMWESAGTDLRPLLDADKADVTKLSAVTSTPMHVFFPDAASGSAEGSALLREEHIAKVENRLLRATESVRDDLAIGFALAGDEERARRKLIRPLWAPTQRHSMSERYDAWSKAAGVPWRTKMTRVLGFSEAETDRAETERAEELLDAALVAPEPVTADDGT